MLHLSEESPNLFERLIPVNIQKCNLNSRSNTKSHRVLQRQVLYQKDRFTITSLRHSSSFLSSCRAQFVLLIKYIKYTFYDIPGISNIK